jgi:hypothetical protein
MVDGDMPAAEIKKLNALLIVHLRSHMSDLRRRIVNADNAVRAVMRSTNEVSAGFRPGKPDPVSEGEQRQFFSDAILKLMEEA